MPVNVTGEHRREAGWNRAARDDIRRIAEREIGRTDGRAFNSLVDAEQPHVRRHGSPACLIEKRREPLADSIPLVRKSCDRHGDATHVQQKRPRAIEDVNPRMCGEQRIRYRRPFVIAGNDDDRHAGIGNPFQRLERAEDEPRLDAAAIEHVAAVNDEVDFTAESRLQRSLEPVEELTGEAQVRVGDEEETHAKNRSTGTFPHAQNARHSEGTTVCAGWRIHRLWSGDGQMISRTRPGIPTAHPRKNLDGVDACGGSSSALSC